MNTLMLGKREEEKVKTKIKMTASVYKKVGPALEIVITNVMEFYQNKPAVCPSKRRLRSRPQNHGPSTVTAMSEHLQPRTAR